MRDFSEHAGCSFCAEIRCRDTNNLFHSVLGREIGFKYILEETTNFVVIPSIGALVPGYLLVLPRQHVLSFGQIESSQISELVYLLNRVERRLQEEFGSPVICFEHGTVSRTKRGGSCADHAHLHLAPVPPNVDLVSTTSQDFKQRQIHSLAALRRWNDLGVPYLFIRNGKGRMYAFDAPKVQSQYLRRKLAEQLGIGDRWDWAVFSGASHIRATIKAFDRRLALKRVVGQGSLTGEDTLHAGAPTK